MMKKLLFMLIAVIPLGTKMPYLLSAWRNSRLDQWDWIFYLAAIPALLYAGRKKMEVKFDLRALFLLVPMLALALGTALHRVNALGVAASAVLIFSVCWLVYSWRAACALLPGTMILLLGTPSSSYAFSLLLMCPVWLAWTVKFLLAGVSVIWQVCNERFNWQIRMGTLFFVAAMAGSGFLLLHSKELYFEGRSFIPEFSGHVADFWGRSIEPDENTKRFFVTSTVRQYRYTRGDTDVSVLAVKCGNDIHEIHPASHCLRTSFWTINSEKSLYLQDDFAVTEIEAEKGANRFLIWVWYSSDTFSTPGFLGFRRHFRSDGNYFTCQLSTRIDKDTEQSRKVLRQFIGALNHRTTVKVKEMKP